ncbi:MAG: GumC family protein [Desulfobacterales bacterium]
MVGVQKEQSQIDVLKKYMNLLLNRYRLIAVCVFIAVSAGFFFYLSQPKIYESSASIIYQEQRINPSRFSPDESRQMREMVNTVAQQVMSRGNLENMIKNYSFYQNPERDPSMEELIARARENINVTMQRDRGNVFSVSFQGKDPSTVMDVTNWLASKFIEENLRVREERARETSTYIHNELGMAKERLNKKEAEMRDYKLKHYNEMPDQRAANMSRLNALQEQFQALQTNIYNLEQTRLLMSEQLEIRRGLQDEETAAAEAAGEGPESTTAQELAEARSSLNDLLDRYTSEHPQVKRQQQRISRIEARLETERRQQTGTEQQELPGIGDAEETVVAERDAELLSRQDTRIGELAGRIREIDVNLSTLRKESDNILMQIGNYQKWVEAAPIREAEWASLTRDYEELRDYHDELLSQSLGAEAAESLEISQKGSQFKVVDPAFMPKTPVKGTFLKILLASIAAGLAAGGGIAFGLEFMNTSFKDAKEVENFLQLPVTCALPLIVTEKEQKRAMIKRIAWFSFFAVWLAALITAGVYFWQQGEIII